MKTTRVQFLPVIVPTLAAILSIAATAPKATAAEFDILAVSQAATPVKALVSAFQASHPGDRISVRYFPAARAESELKAGVSSDLLILADFDDMKNVAKNGAVDAATVGVFATDRLVLCAPAYTPLGSLQELAGGTIQHVAIVNPSHGESGMKAILALNHAGIWAGVQPKIMHGDDAAQVIQYMEKGNAQAGLLLWTDAVGVQDIRVVGSFERPYAEPIRYTSAVSSHARGAATAREFQTFLGSAQAREILKTMGYGVQ